MARSSHQSVCLMDFSPGPLAKHYRPWWLIPSFQMPFFRGHICTSQIPVQNSYSARFITAFLALWHLKQPCVSVIELHFIPLRWINTLYILMEPDISKDPWSHVRGCFLWLSSWLCEGYGQMLEGAAVCVGLCFRTRELHHPSVT